MRPTNYLPSSALLLSTLAPLTLFSLPAMAQKGDGDSKPTPGDRASPSATPSDKASPSPTPKRPPKSDKQASSSSSETPADKSSSDGGSSMTPTTTAATTDTPTTTASSSATTGGMLTGFPTLTRGGAIPTYPPPAVPPTQNAPFMKHSNMPDGTVFIVVGAILGAFGLAILLWRSIVSLLLHRSVKRAALAQHSDNIKAGFPAPPAPFYKYTDQDSTMSLGAGTAAAVGRGVRRTTRGPIPSTTPSHSNLFFSPTAANSPSGARASTFLPSGFYASGSGSPAANHTTSISLNNLGPDSRGHYATTSRNNTMSGSPPDSPQYAARRDASATSTSSLHLNSLTPGQRAPSAYLEDLLADDASFLPPPQMPPSTGPRNTMSPGGRTGNLPNRT